MNCIIHQCFLTPRALYLLVWDVRDDLEGVEKLCPWLLSIQVSSSSLSKHCILFSSLDVQNLAHFLLTKLTKSYLELGQVTRPNLGWARRLWIWNLTRPKPLDRS